MLPTDLLIHRQNGEKIKPTRLKLDQKHQNLTTQLLSFFEEAVGQTQGLIERQ